MYYGLYVKTVLLFIYSAWRCQTIIIDRKRIMSSKVIFLVVVGLLAVVALGSLDSQYVPVSRRFPGLVIGNDNSAVTVELVYDPTCDSSAEFDQTIRQVISKLSDDQLAKMTFRYAISALPYHIASFKLAQAVRYVFDQRGSAQALQVLRRFLDNIENWDQASLLKISIDEYLNKVAKEVAAQTGLPSDIIRLQLNHFTTNDAETRKWTKYVMGTLRIPGTPFIFVNGARLDGASDLTSQQLTDYLVKLL